MCVDVDTSFPVRVTTEPQTHASTEYQRSQKILVYICSADT